MITFKKYGKTVKISNKHWKSLRARFNPKYAEILPNKYSIYKNCLLCVEHLGCDRCGFVVFEKTIDSDEIIEGCHVFLLRLFKDRLAFFSGDMDKVEWLKKDDDLARKQLQRIQKLMDEIEAQQA